MKTLLSVSSSFAKAKMGAKLRHPNIVPIYEVSSNRRAHYMVMDFIEGRDLREFVRIRKKLNTEEALKFSTDIAAGLAYAAEFGIRHRDLKLSNVLMSSTGRAQLVDFGLAAVSGEIDDESDGLNPRTIDYAGLERLTGVRKDDPRSDIYFAGCMFYHMLTGKPPLSETKDRSQRLSKTRFENIPPITDLEPDLPNRVVQIVKKAMELNVKRRYQSPAEYLADMQLCAKRMHTSEAELALLEEGANRAVMIVDSNPEMQDAFRKGLKKVGYRVLVVSDASRAIDRCDTNDKVADCVVFGCHSLGRSGLEAFNQVSLKWTTRKRHRPVLILAEKQTRFAEEAKLAEKRVVAKLPLKMKEFRGLLRGLLATEDALVRESAVLRFWDGLSHCFQ